MSTCPLRHARTLAYPASLIIGLKGSVCRQGIVMTAVVKAVLRSVRGPFQTLKTIMLVVAPFAFTDSVFAWTSYELTARVMGDESGCKRGTPFAGIMACRFFCGSRDWSQCPNVGSIPDKLNGTWLLIRSLDRRSDPDRRRGKVGRA
jgi:hypothetical protein